MDRHLQSNMSAPHEGYLHFPGAELYCRVLGKGQPIFVLHGGPDFDHNYLLPEMDRLADVFRLIHCDQRGRGKSTGNVVPEEISLQSEIADPDAVRAYFRLESLALLGSS